MELRRIEGQTAVCGLFGDSWVYLNAGEDSLRLVNVPGWVTTETLATSFEKFSGEISGAYSIADNIAKNRVRIATLHMSTASVAKIIKAPAAHLVAVECVPGAENNVLNNWKKEYEEARDISRVREWADATMTAYETREQKAEEIRRKQRESGPDDDGFTLVVDGFKRTKMDNKNNKLMVEVGSGKRIAVKEAHVEEDGFYRWQKKSKIADIDGLRKRFDQDKKRVAAAAALKPN